MATKSFLKDVVIKDNKTALNFINAMEKAEKAKKEDVTVKYNTVESENEIRQLFN